MVSELPAPRPTLSPKALERERRAKRHPRPTQFDYLHLRYLVRDLARALEEVAPPRGEALDVFCGSRPYEDLLPAGLNCVGLDIDDHYGVADVVTTEFLPFPDEAFDLVMCIEAFYYLDPTRAPAELRRVLRRGGVLLVAVPLMWEYDRRTVEYRYTGPSLAALFPDWEDVEVVENGGRAVSWALVTGRMIWTLEARVARRLPLRLALRPLFAATYLAMNGIAALADRFEQRSSAGSLALPPNVLLTARRPENG